MTYVKHYIVIVYVMLQSSSGSGYPRRHKMSSFQFSACRHGERCEKGRLSIVNANRQGVPRLTPGARGAHAGSMVTLKVFSTESKE